MTAPARSILLLLLVAAAAGAARPSTRGTADLPLTTAGRIVVLGDSITYQGGYVALVETSLRAAAPQRAVDLVNLGLPSETVSGLSEPGHAGGRFPRPDLHERLDRVLERTAPDLVVACYGMNCGIYHPYDDERFDAFRRGVERLRARVTDAGATLVFLTPPVFDAEPIRARTIPAGAAAYPGPYRGYDEVLDLYSAWLLAQRGRGWLVVDVHGPMRRALDAARDADPDHRLADDGVHPSPRGHWLIAREVLRAAGAPADVVDAEDGTDFLDRIGADPRLLELVASRQRLLRDAWLASIGHRRPGLPTGPPLEEAQRRATEIDAEIATLLAPAPDPQDAPATPAS